LNDKKTAPLRIATTRATMLPTPVYTCTHRNEVRREKEASERRKRSVEGTGGGAEGGDTCACICM